jgi:Domain of unknown function (DUF6457)
MSTLDRWTAAACAELGLDPAAADTRAVLDLAREAAHRVERPAAPVTAYLLGVAVGRGQPLAAAAERLRRLAAGWEAERPQPSARPARRAGTGLRRDV